MTRLTMASRPRLLDLCCRAGGASMGIGWPMKRDDLREAIPPAYTRWIGTQLLAQLTGAEVAA